MSDKNIHISFSNKVPQWAVRQTMEGALQPKTAGTASHPDLVPNKELLSLLGRNGTRTAKTREQIEADLAQIAKVSPVVKHIATSEINIKKANSTSKVESERWAAVKNTQCEATCHSASEALISNVIRPVRTGTELTSEGHSKYASKLPGGMSLGDADATISRTASDQISEFSRDAIRAAKEAYASKYAKTSTAEENRELQKSRTIGRDSVFNMNTASFSSSRQAYENVESNLDNTYALFQKKITPDSSVNPQLNELAAALSDRLTNRITSMRKDKATWNQAALADINNRITHAASKSARIVEAEEKDRQDRYSKEVPTLDKVAWALSREPRQVADNKSDSLQHTASRNLKITERTITAKVIDQPSSVTRPSTSVVDNMLKSVASTKSQEVNNGYEVI